MIRATLTSERTADIHEQPHWLRRLMFGAVERDYEVQRICVGVGVGRYEWVGGDNRHVRPAVREAIERALTLKAVKARIASARIE
ncbi:MAG TPA: hypothetical protein VFQ42_21915 [Mycobacterium sp.]|nr:hypothetical protein [Mycobacterium sp.]